MIIKALSPAKINLFLNVAPLADRQKYHRISSYVAKLPLYDELELKLINSDDIEVSTVVAADLAQQTIEKNIIHEAATLLRNHGHKRGLLLKGAKIKLQKNIPIAAGLGGGSSNAAVVLVLLNRLWKLNLAETELQAIGATIGCDVPLFISKRSSMFCRNRGEIVAPHSFKRSYYVLLINPKVALSTAAVYAKYDSQEFSRAINEQSGDIEQIIYGANDLQRPAITLCPFIATIIERLQEMPGCIVAKMTGSGPTCFALFSRQELALKASNSLEKIGDYFRFVGKITI